MPPVCQLKVVAVRGATACFLEKAIVSISLTEKEDEMDLAGRDFQHC
jgi:hypothetical protein